MHSDNDRNTANNSDNRRKRINRLKKLIIFVTLLLILLPTIGCIILGISVSRLQNQVNELTERYGIHTDTQSLKEGYAYAAVKNGKAPLMFPPVTPFMTGNDLKDIIADITYHNEAQNTDTDTHATDKNDYNSKISNDNNNTIDKTSQSDLVNQSKSDKKGSKGKGFDKGIYEGEKIYLTFDDGPSKYTAEILDTLAKYDVKATFFVIGKTDEASKELYKRIVNEGHTLGMHSYSHRYDIIYKSIEDFDKDFTKLWKLLYDTTGYKPSIYRFPGGSGNLVNNNGMDKFIKYLKDKSVVYFDWNVVNQDATNKAYTKKQLINNILDGLAGKERAIVLMHDTQTKKTTVDSLPKLIETLISGGAQILPLDEKVEPIQMIKADQVK